MSEAGARLTAELGRAIDQALNGGVEPKAQGYILIVAPFGDTTGYMDLSTNIDDRSLVMMLREIVARKRGQVVDEAGKA